MQPSPTLRNDTDPFVAPLRDNEFLVDLVADISGTSPKEVVGRFVREHDDLGTNVREAMIRQGIRPYTWSSELEEFYASTDAFLFESLVWNRTATKIDMRRWIGSYLRSVSDSPLRVLTFGDGSGLDAYFLAEAGHNVAYFDASRQCAEFAHRIFDHGGLEVKMLSDVSEVSEASFDVVLCLDVLEHVPDPVSLVAWLTQRLRPKGRLVVHAPFYFLHSSVATHLRSNKRFSGDLSRLYKSAGLRLVDGRTFWNPIVLEKHNSVATKRWRHSLWSIVFGGAILSAARIWSLPHAMITRGVMRSNRRQLNKLVAGLKSGTDVEPGDTA